VNIIWCHSTASYIRPGSESELDISTQSANEPGDVTDIPPENNPSSCEAPPRHTAMKPTALLEGCVGQNLKVADLWLQMLKFYALEYPIEDQVCLCFFTFDNIVRGLRTSLSVLAFLLFVSSNLLRGSMSSNFASCCLFCLEYGMFEKQRQFVFALFVSCRPGDQCVSFRPCDQRR